MLNPLPSSWSELSWQQLCDVWTAKQKYSGNSDVAVVAAWLSLYELQVETAPSVSDVTGESVYCLRGADGQEWTATARELAYYAHLQLEWFAFPYGDPGEPEEKDGKGNITKERREPKRGYVSPMRDAMILPRETVIVHGRHFALPQVACNNLTWHQYRSLQTTAPQLFADNVSDQEAIRLQATFLSTILTPRSVALLDTAGGSIRLRPHYEYRYDAVQADGLVKFWEKRLTECRHRKSMFRHDDTQTVAATLFHICFQTYQTAIAYYAASYPLLFQDSGKSDPLRDALTGEVGTINTVMKYAGYAEQQQVYDSNLPFILDILNTMTKEAKEIERMNARIKKH